jgi:periplasmic copper chaperone A
MSRLLRLVLAVGVGAATFVLATGSSSAHVTVNPREAAPGSYAKLSFRVPNERPDASTTSLAVQLPTDHPFASVSVRPTPGWTATPERAPLANPIDSHGRQITEALSTITWSGGSIAPGEFQEFEVSVGPLPEGVDSLVFPAVQTYSSGEVVRWIERTQAGQAEPERPAPVLALTAGEENGNATATTAPTTSGDAHQQAGANRDGDDEDGSGNGLAVVALVIGGLGLLAGVGGIAMARRH